MFYRYHWSSAAATPVKYERDIQQVPRVLEIMKNWEKEQKVKEEIGLLTLTSG